MGLGDFLQALGNITGQQIPQGQEGPMPQSALSRFGQGMSGIASGIQGALQNPGLQAFGAQDTQRRNDEHMAKVFAANPSFATQLYNAKNTQMRATSAGHQQKFAAIELANEIQKARASGDTQRLNDLLVAAKSLDKGVIQNADGTAQTMTGYPDVLGQLQYGKQTGTELAKNQNEPGRAGAVENAQLDAQLGKKPTIAGLEKTAQLNADRQGGIGDKVLQAKSNIGIIDEAVPLIDKATGSGIGTLLAAGKQAAGISDEKTKANAQLLVLSGRLLNNVPRMEGPQSDKDVASYREQAGKLGDPTVPAGDKRAAADIIRKLSEKYTAQNDTPLSQLGLESLDSQVAPQGNSAYGTEPPIPSMGVQNGSQRMLKYNRATGRIE